MNAEKWEVSQFAGNLLYDMYKREVSDRDYFAWLEVVSDIDTASNMIEAIAVLEGASSSSLSEVRENVNAVLRHFT